jgi:hypothetical protein
MAAQTHPAWTRSGRALAVLAAVWFLSSPVAPAGAQIAAPPTVGVEIPAARPSQTKSPSDQSDPTAAGSAGLPRERHGLPAADPGEASTTRAEPQSTNDWRSWSDLPRPLPPGGYFIPKQRATGDLAPERFPGIVLWDNKNANGTGPPRSLNILNQLTNVAYQDAVKALLIGPDQQIFAEYAKSPDGRYVLELPSEKDFTGGRFEIRILIDGSDAVVIRRISILAGPGAGARPSDNPGHLNIYISKEAIDRSSKSGYTPPRTTFETDAEGEKFLRAGVSEIDRALVHYKEAYEALDSRSSYELRWKITLNYAKALHDATLWHQYNYAADARRMLEAVLTEYKTSGSKPFWRFWQPALQNIGIAEADIVEPLRDLQALELQSLPARYFINGEPTAVNELSASMREFARRFSQDEEALSKRVDIDPARLKDRLQLLQHALVKLTAPALVELEDGNFLMKPVADQSPTAVPAAVRDRGFPRGSVETDPLRQVLEDRSKPSSAKEELK